MQVYGTTQLHGPQAIGAPHNRLTPSYDVARPASAGDEVQISSLGQLLDRLGDVPEIRADRVAQVRAALAQGVYETDDKLSAALDRLLDEIG
jgi:negative regulator of flagellin synthesis FlgM